MPRVFVVKGLPLCTKELQRSVLLSWLWSPEQISSVGKLIGLAVSHEWIYRHVADDKRRGGKLYKALRQGHKRYRRGSNSKRPVNPDPRSIDDRPPIVDTRCRFGDWEVDTVLGKQGTGHWSRWWSAKTACIWSVGSLPNGPLA